MIAFFKGTYDGNIKIDPSEVKKVQSFSLEDIQRMIEQGKKLHPECLVGLKEYFLKK